MSILPDELVEEILARVPEEAFPKLKLVSKSWETLINSPEFKHLRSLRHGTRFIFQVGHYEFRGRIYAMDCVDSPEMLKPAELRTFPFLSSTCAFWGSCYSFIFCSSLYGLDLVLWNPNTNQHVKLPPYPNTGSAMYYGLGYDAARDDYKVVRLGHPNESQIYSVRSRTWKKLPDQYPFFLGRDGLRCYRSVFANNALHWISYDEILVALDLTTEKYHHVPLPQHGEIVWTDSLHVLDGYLCWMVLNIQGNVDMWMMMKYGAKDSWTKLRLQLSKTDIPTLWEFGGLMEPILMYSRGSGNTYVVFHHVKSHARYLIWYDIKQGLVHHQVLYSTKYGKQGRVVNYSRA